MKRYFSSLAVEIPQRDYFRIDRIEGVFYTHFSTDERLLIKKEP